MLLKVETIWIRIGQKLDYKMISIFLKHPVHLKYHFLKKKTTYICLIKKNI